MYGTEYGCIVLKNDMISLLISAVQWLIPSKIKVCVYIINVCVLCKIILYI